MPCRYCFKNLSSLRRIRPIPLKGKHCDLKTMDSHSNFVLPAPDDTTSAAILETVLSNKNQLDQKFDNPPAAVIIFSFETEPKMSEIFVSETKQKPLLTYSKMMQSNRFFCDVIGLVKRSSKTVVQHTTSNNLNIFFYRVRQISSGNFWKSLLQ